MASPELDATVLADAGAQPGGVPVVAPRARRSGTSSGSLASSGDTVHEAVRRLRMITLVLTVVPPFALTLTILVAPPGTPQHDARGLMATVVGAGVLSSALVRRLLGDERIPAARRLDIGFAYQVLLAFVVGVARHLTPWAAGDGFREVSPLAVIILVFAALIPNKPRRTLAASLLAAAMDPVGLAISIARGNPMPPLAQAVFILGTPFVASIGATAISKVIYGLARTADEARRMGSYELVEKLGSGGMGEVWLARHRLLARPAAIKLIRGGAAGDLGAVARFEREAQATAALREPHTIQLYDFGVTEDGTFYYVMELLDGVDLEALVEKHGPLPAERVVHLLLQVCASLAEAHERGLVHRDIKPANLYVCRHGRQVDFMKVLDFGLVKPQREAAAPELAPTVTIEGSLAGTPAFLAPEMALGEKDIDGRADIYALGCVAFWLLTGRFVFEADTAMKMVVSHARSAPTAPSKATELEVPEALDRLVLRCLEKEPDKRPASAADLADELEAIELAHPWTKDRARTWWSTHAPARSPAVKVRPVSAA